MKIFFAFILIALVSFSLGLFFPWWTIAIAGFLVALFIPIKPGIAFITGFSALFLLWGVLSFVMDARNQHILASKVGVLLKLGPNPLLLVLLSALIGGLVTGMAALSGSYLRRAINNPSSPKYVEQS